MNQNLQDFRNGKKSLELCCYVAGAGAFGVFIRWLQLQLAFNDLGLADPSFLHVFLILFVAAAAFVFLRFTNRFEHQGLYLPDEFSPSFANSGRLFMIARIAGGFLIVAGALLLFMQTDTDKNSTDYKILSALALLSGFSFPIWLGSANRKTPPNPTVSCVLIFFPMLWMAAWLVLCYKFNTINSVIWSYVVELVTVAACMNAFFRLGGWSYSKPRWKLCLFSCMLAASLCILSIADQRHLGMQLMFIGCAVEFILCCWIMVQNFHKEVKPEKAPKPENTGGFEAL